MNTKILKKRKNGFTLLETLIVVAILAILAGLAIVGVPALQKKTEQKRLDSNAEIIYMAAQARLSELRTSGRSDVFTPDGKNGIQEWNGAVPSNSSEVMPHADWKTEEMAYICVGKGSPKSVAAANEILPRDSVDGKVWDGSWVIEYNYRSGTVWGVFYTDNKDTDLSGYAPSDYYNNLRTDANRKDGKIGYYGYGSAHIKIIIDIEPSVSVYNGDEDVYVEDATGVKEENYKGEKLFARFAATVDSDVALDTLPNITLKYIVHQLPNYEVDSVETVDYKALIKDGYSITDLDYKKSDIKTEEITVTMQYSEELGFYADIPLDVLGGDDTFKDFVESTNNVLTPGANMYIELVENSADVDISDANLKKQYIIEEDISEDISDNYFNSLFDNNTVIATDGAKVRGFAGISSGRHLQNLNAASGVSGIQEAHLNGTIEFTSAEGSTKTAWEDYVNLAFDPIENDKLEKFEGNYDSAEGDDAVTIKGFAINDTGDDANKTALGIFKKLDNEIVVQNLKLTSAKIQLSGNGGVFANVGLIAGESGDATIENCVIDGSISSSQYRDGHFGGAVGLVSGKTTIKETTTTASVENNIRNSGSGDVGGLVGHVEAAEGKTASLTIKDCEYTEPEVVSAMANAGGLVGYAGAATTITNSGVYYYNEETGTGITESDFYYVKGVNCGGLIGKVGVGATVDVADSFASVVAGKYDNNDTPSATYAGGLVGLVSGGVTVKGSYAGGYTYGAYVAGLVGGLDSANATVNIQDSYAAGYLFGTTEQSGLVNSGDVDGVTAAHTYTICKPTADIPYYATAEKLNADNFSDNKTVFYAYSTTGFGSATQNAKNTNGERITAEWYEGEKNPLDDAFEKTSGKTYSKGGIETVTTVFKQNNYDYPLPQLKNMTHYGQWSLPYITSVKAEVENKEELIATFTVDTNTGMSVPGMETPSFGDEISVEYSIYELDGSILDDKGEEVESTYKYNDNGEQRVYASTVTANSQGGNTFSATVTLDSLNDAKQPGELTGDDQYFRVTCPGLTPGANMRVEASVACNDNTVMPASSDYKDDFNSLFADSTFYKQNLADGEVNEAQIAYGRHLQNLDTDTSKVDAGITEATVISDIKFGTDSEWQKNYSDVNNGKFTPINNTNIMLFEGGEKTISDISLNFRRNATNGGKSEYVRSGIFGDVKNITVQNTYLKNPVMDLSDYSDKITDKDGISNSRLYVGTIVSSTSKLTENNNAETIIDNCKISGAIIKVGDSNYTTQVGTIAGVAIGKTTISNCISDGCSITSTGKARMGGIIGTLAKDGSSITLCTVNNLTVTSKKTSYLAGLVGRVTYQATLKDNKLENITLKMTGSSGSSYAGGVCADIALSSKKDITVDNCDISKITITSGNSRCNMSAIAGRITENCNILTISNCDISNLTVKATKYSSIVGAFAGILSATNPTIEKCTVNGAEITTITQADKTDPNNASAGIGKSTSALKMSDCSFKTVKLVCHGANIISNAAAVIAENEATAELTNCNVDGLIICGNSTETSVKNSGGIVGTSTGEIILDTCTVKNADIKIKGDNITSGALVGSTSGKTTVKSCNVAENDIEITTVTATSDTVTINAYVSAGVASTTQELSVTGSTFSGNNLSAHNATSSKKINAYIGGVVGYTSNTFNLTGGEISGTKLFVYNNSYSGAIAGYLSSNSYKTTIKSTNVSGTVINAYGSKMYASSGVAYSKEELEISDNCAFTDNTINFAKSSSGGYCGDAVGYCIYTTNVENCTSDNFKITGTGAAYAGGLVGVGGKSGTEFKVKNCKVSNATVYGSTCSGGAVGLTRYASLIDNTEAVDCRIDGKTAVGGILGAYRQDDNASQHTLNINGCKVYYTNLKAADPDNIAASAMLTGENNIGGIVGYNYYYKSKYNSGIINITNSFAAAVMSSSTGSAAGLVGNSGTDGKVTITGSYADCYVLGAKTAGLVCGDNVTVTNSYAQGYVYGTTKQAGLVIGSNATLTNCYTAVYPGNRDIYTATAETGTAENTYYIFKGKTGNTTIGTRVNSKDLEENSKQLVGKLGSAFAVDTLDRTEGTTIPYKLVDPNLKAPNCYPVLVGLQHYGDWNEVDFFEFAVTINNTNKLTAEFTGTCTSPRGKAPDEVLLSYVINEGENTSDPTSIQAIRDGETYSASITLDSLDEHFNFENITPGKNVTLTLSLDAEEVGAMDDVTTDPFNSLFADETTDDTAVILYERHLQNLGRDNVTSDIKNVSVEHDLDWTRKDDPNREDAFPGRDFVPIINSNITGSFGGGSHTIANITVSSGSGFLDNAGMFAEFNGSSVNYITLDNFTVNGDGYVGAFAGNIVNECNASYCTVSSSNVTASGATKMAGGFAGYAVNKLTALELKVTDSEITTTGDQTCAAAICGQTTSATEMTGCTVTGTTVKAEGGTTFVGLLTGMTSSTFTVDGAELNNNTLTAQGSGAYLGGASAFTNGTVEIGKLNADKLIINGSGAVITGGIIGCEQNGNLTIKESTVKNADITSVYTAGGVIGIALKTSTISDTDVIDTKLTSSDLAGGIAGCSRQSAGDAITMTITDCHVYLDTVDKTTEEELSSAVKLSGITVGGLVAMNCGDNGPAGTLNITSGSASTVLKGTSGAGGLVGSADGNVTIENSYADCYILGGNTAGIACGNSVTLKNSYAQGYVYGTTKQAGLVLGSNAALTNCYTAVYPGNRDIYTAAAETGTAEKAYYVFKGKTGNTTIGTRVNSKDLEENSKQLVGKLGSAFAVDTLDRTEGVTVPYNLIDQGLKAPNCYPVLAGLQHYGDWNEVDFFEFTVTINNTNTLTAEISGTCTSPRGKAPDDVLLSYIINEGENKSDPRTIQANRSGETYSASILLDSLDESFSFENITPGKSVTLTLSLDAEEVGVMHDVTTDPFNSLFDNDTTADTAYISYERHLQNLKTKGIDHITGVFVENDLDWTRADAFPERGFIPISNANINSFDGNNKTVSNITVEEDSTNAGIFEAYYGSSVKNLTIKAISAKGACDAIGGFAANLHTACVVDNCNAISPVLSTTLSRAAIGGLFGNIVSDAEANTNPTGTEIKNCTVSGATLTNNDQTAYIGCIAGTLNTGYDSQTESIVGTIKVTDCTCTGNTISGTSGATGDYCGDITGYSYTNAVITGCSSTNLKISNSAYSGAIIGCNQGGKASITGTTASKANINGKRAGGLIGINLDSVDAQSCTVTDCILTGGTGSSYGSGGIIGYNRQDFGTKSVVVINNCKVYLTDVTDLTATSYQFTGANAGGLVGCNVPNTSNAGLVKITNSFASTILNGSLYASGLVANGGVVEVENSYADCYIYGGSTAGIACGNSVKLTNSYAQGYLYGNTQAGLVEGTNAVIKNCYTATAPSDQTKYAPVALSASGDKMFYVFNGDRASTVGTRVTKAQLLDTSAVLAKDLGAAFDVDTATSGTTPYNLLNQDLKAPNSYPVLKGITHYGDWQDIDEYKFTIEIINKNTLTAKITAERVRGTGNAPDGVNLTYSLTEVVDTAKKSAEFDITAEHDHDEIYTATVTLDELDHAFDYTGITKGKNITMTVKLQKDVLAVAEEVTSEQFNSLFDNDTVSNTAYLSWERHLQNLKTTGIDHITAVTVKNDLDWTRQGNADREDAFPDRGFVPITNNKITGTFDGGSHTIANISVKSGYSDAGIFTTFYGNKVINLTLDYPTVTGTGYVAAFAGILNNACEVDTCTVSDATITSTASNKAIGGFTAMANNKLTANKVTVKDSNITITGNSVRAAAICGNAKSATEMKGCVVTGTHVTSNGATSYTALLAGTSNTFTVDKYDNDHRTILTNNTLTGDGSNAYIGGVVGSMNSIVNISNVDVEILYINGTGVNISGGIVGCEQSGTLTISDCTVRKADVLGKYTAGGVIGIALKVSAVENTDVIDTKVSFVSGGSAMVGGIAGSNRQDNAGTTVMTITNCHVYLQEITQVSQDALSGAVKLSGSKVGGLVGYNFGNKVVAGTLTITGSSASTVINSTDRAGGLVGMTDGATAIEKSYADCYILGKNTAGLVCGTNVTITNCYSQGYLYGTNEQAGIVIGTGATLSHCYAATATNAEAIYSAIAKTGTGTDSYYVFKGKLGTISDNRVKGTYLLNNSAQLVTKLGTAFESDTESRGTTPYNLLNQGLEAPMRYPVLKGLTHYGDWADVDEFEFSVKIVNTNTLTAEITATRIRGTGEAPSTLDITYCLNEGSFSSTAQTVTLNGSGEVFTKTVTLDSLDDRFNVEGITKGKNITLTVKLQEDVVGVAENYTTEEFNNLFANETTSDTAVIAYERHLQNLARTDVTSAISNITVNSHADKTLDWTNITPARKFEPIPSSNKYVGKLEGNGNTIKNLNIKSGSDNGLFVTFNGTSIKNLTLDKLSATGSGNVGAFAGILTKKCTTLEGCKVNASTLKSTAGGKSIGGIFGQNDACTVKLTVKSCGVSGTTMTTTSGTTYIGSVTGDMRRPAEVTGCTFNGNKISATGSTAFCGDVFGRTNSNVTIGAADTASKVTSTGLKISGSGAKYCGGIIGGVEVNKATIVNCEVSTANISSANAGGIIGLSIDSASMTSCNVINSTVKGNNANSGGGIIGWNRQDKTSSSKTEIINCGVYITSEYASEISKDTYLICGKNAGGLIGLNAPDSTSIKNTAVIKNSFASTIINGYTNAGGLVGTVVKESSKIGNVEIDSSYADCYIYGTYTAGIACGDKVTLTNSYAAGFLYGTANQAGLVYSGAATGTKTVSATNCYTVTVTSNRAIYYPTISRGTWSNVYYGNRGSKNLDDLYDTFDSLYKTSQDPEKTDYNGKRISDSYISDKAAFAAKLNSAVFSGGAVNTHVYFSAPSYQYSFPSIQKLDHYGDWNIPVNKETFTETTCYVYYELYKEGGIGVYDVYDITFGMFHPYSVHSQYIYNSTKDKTVIGDGYGVMVGIADNTGVSLTIGGKTYTYNNSIPETDAKFVMKTEEGCKVFSLTKEVYDAAQTSIGDRQISISGMRVTSPTAISNVESQIWSDTHFARNGGEESHKSTEPYYVRTPRHLSYLSTLSENISGYTFEQERDMNYPEYDWTNYTVGGTVQGQKPIATAHEEKSTWSSKYVKDVFESTYNGNCYKITGFTLLTSTVPATTILGTAVKVGGLFGYVGENAVIKNIVMDGVGYSMAPAFEEKYLAGCLVASLSDNAKIENCAVYGYTMSSGQLKSGSCQGGLVGTASENTQITNCEANIYYFHWDPKNAVVGVDVGAFIGSNAGTVNNCYALTVFNKGDSHDTTYVGGFAGNNTGTLQNCYCASTDETNRTGNVFYGPLLRLGTSTNCYYLYQNNLYYRGNSVNYNWDRLSYGRATARSLDQLAALKGAGLASFGTAPGTNLPAIVKDSTGAFVHYGISPSTTASGSNSSLNATAPKTVSLSVAMPETIVTEKATPVYVTATMSDTGENVTDKLDITLTAENENIVIEKVIADDTVLDETTGKTIAEMTDPDTGKYPNAAAFLVTGYEKGTDVISIDAVIREAAADTDDESLEEVPLMMQFYAKIASTETEASNDTGELVVIPTTVTAVFVDDNADAAEDVIEIVDDGERHIGIVVNDGSGVITNDYDAVLDKTASTDEALILPVPEELSDTEANLLLYATGGISFEGDDAFAISKVNVTDVYGNEFVLFDKAVSDEWDYSNYYFMPGNAVADGQVVYIPVTFTGSVDAPVRLKVTVANADETVELDCDVEKLQTGFNVIYVSGCSVTGEETVAYGCMITEVGLLEGMDEESIAKAMLPVYCDTVIGAQREELVYTIEFAYTDMDSVSARYGREVKLPFYSGEGSFVGWALTEGGEALIADGASVTNLCTELGGTVTLYPVFAEEEMNGEETVEEAIPDDIEILTDSLVNDDVDPTEDTLQPEDTTETTLPENPTMKKPEQKPSSEEGETVLDRFRDWIVS